MNTHQHLCEIAIVGALAVLPVAPAEGQALVGDAEQVVTVERPAGQVGIDVSTDPQGHLDVTVTDTRSDDPGWSVVVEDSGGGWWARVTQTPPFTDATGRRYEQRVVLHAPASAAHGSTTVASAPAQHGLGIAHLTMQPRTFGASDTVTVTVI